MNSMKSVIIAAGFVLAAILPVFGQDSSYSINGEIKIKKAGTIFIYLVNKEIFKKAETGLQVIEHELSAEDLEKGCFNFSFENIPEGEYGVRCFIDKNGNGECDKGLFGPIEPWGMSWKKKKPFGAPKFSQMSFILNSDIQLKIST